MLGNYFKLLNEKAFVFSSKTENFNKLSDIERNQLINIIQKNAVVDE